MKILTAFLNFIILFIFANNWKNNGNENLNLESTHQDIHNSIYAKSNSCKSVPNFSFNFYAAHY